MAIRTVLITAAHAVIILLALASAAISADWRVVQMSGGVFIQQGSAQLVSLGQGSIIGSGAVVITQRNGRVRLSRGAQTIVVSPNTVLSLPADSGKVTKVLQTVGEAEFHVDSRRLQHFSVETPYLTAVVKGTRFSVDVRREMASVGVYNGRVEVKNLKSGDVVDVLPGQRGTVSSLKGISVKGVGAIQKVKPGLPRAAIVVPATPKQVISSFASSTVGVGTVSVGYGNKSMSSDYSGNRGGNVAPNRNPNGGGDGDGDGDGDGGDGDGDDDGDDDGDGDD